MLQGSVLTKLDGQEQSLELSNFSERFALPRFINERQMRIEWEDPLTFETGFELERRIGDGTFELVATVPADTVSYVDRFDFIDREIY